ncbi:MAG: hypothetical protein ABIP55_10385 [Tepidisphaeraceae bacterium]
MTRSIPVTATMAAALLLAGCTPTVRVKHEVEPIHLTADINIRVDRQLDQFFSYQDQPTTTATTAPVAVPPIAPAPQAASGEVK